MTKHSEHRARFEAACAARHGANRVLTGEQLDACYARMAGEIDAAVAGHNPVLICVMVGGLMPTAHLAERLDFAFELDYLQATRYGFATSGDSLVWKASPETDLAGRHVVVIDDILDEGQTLHAILSALAGQGVASLTTAVLLKKRHDRCVPELAADIIGAEIPDRFVFGAGMDYRGYFRQLRDVWALADDVLR